MQVNKQQLEPDMDQQTGSILGKEYVKTEYYFYAEYIMWNAGLDEAQTGIKVARRNINNLRYVDDITLVAENEEEVKNFLMRVKEESEVGLKHNIQKTKIMVSSPITSWQIQGEKVEAVIFYFLGLQITVDSDCSHEIKRYLLLERKAMTNLLLLLSRFSRVRLFATRGL